MVHWLWRGLRGGHVQQVVEGRADGEPLGDISEEVERTPLTRTTIDEVRVSFQDGQWEFKMVTLRPLWQNVWKAFRTSLEGLEVKG